MAFTPMPRGAIPEKTIRLSTATTSYLFEVEGAIPYQNLAAFDRKNAIGETSRDDDNLISAYIALFDNTGGGQVLDIKEAEDQSRFYFSTLRTTEPGMLCLNRETRTLTGTYPLGDYSGTDHFYYMVTTAGPTYALWYYDATTALGVDTTKVLASSPVNIGVSFKGDLASTKFFIPVGAAGINVFDGTNISTNTNVTGGVAALYSWSNALYALGLNGQLWKSTDGTTFTWTTARIDGADTPLHLAAFYNRADTLILYAISNRAAYAYDDSNDILFETDLSFPPHPGNGRGANRWRDALYAASGMMVYSYNGGVMGEMGPTRRDGLPAEYRGSILDLRAGHNAMYALVAGSETVDPDPLAEMDFPNIYDDPLLVSSGRALASLLFWNQLGWHTAWVGLTPGAIPTRVYVSGANGEYRLWWGANGVLYTQALERDFHNPRQGLEAGIDRFESSGYIETGYFDANMKGWHKLASHLAVSVEKMYTSCQIRVRAMIDEETNWTLLETITVRGKSVIPFGVDANGYSFGAKFDRIRFQVELLTTDPTKSPLLDSIALYYIKIPNESGAWTVTVNLASDNLGGLGWDSGEQMKTTLDALLEEPGFMMFEHVGQVFRARLAAIANGRDYPGQEFNAGTRVLSIVEVQVLDADTEQAD